MQVDDFIQSIPRAPFSMPQDSWLEGAAAGLRVAENRSPSWLWDGDGLVGSAYDALGGYVSVTGEVTPEGLYFRVPLARQEEVSELLNGLTLLRAN